MSDFIKYMRQMFLQHKAAAFLMIFLAILITAIELLRPQVLVVIIDDAITGKKLRLLVTTSVVYVCLIICHACVSYVSASIRIRVKKNIAYALKQKILVHIQQLPGGFYTEQKTGEILKVMEGDVASLENMGIDFVIDILKNICSALAAFIILFCIHAKLLGIILLLEVCMIYLHNKYVQIISKRLKAVRAMNGTSMSLLEEFVVHMMDIIITNANAVFMRKYLQNESEIAQESGEFEKLVEKNQLIANTLNMLMIAAIYFVSGIWIIRGSMTLGVMMAFVNYTSMLISPILQLTNSNTRIHTALVSLRRIHNILSIQSIEDVGKRTVLNGNISFRDIQFTYENGTNVWNHLHIEAPTGRKIAIVGSSGCGKSTLVKLLFRFWQPQAGNILIDGHPIAEYSLEALRSGIAVVTQDVVLFDDTIKNNIDLNRGYTVEEIRHVCKKIDILEPTSAFSDGLETTVGEQGIKLSGGQKQRIAIARAIISKASIVVFDEATSALDNITQEKILDGMEDYIKNKTVIIITHRMAVTRMADYIYVMDNRKIVEEGTHDSLLQLKGRYADMYLRDT